ncbi:MAG: hypothetical protein CR968_00135 [Flavobacteriia bacterium]|nr:MAG: hypothetical protein CR968_00135 [Flavobacteriia bacterium]
MAKYDDASWHYGGEYPKNLPPKNGATHIGMFLKWCIENNLHSEELEEDAREEIEQLKEGKITGAEFLINVCDEKLTDYDLNDLGNEFAQDYYEDDTDFDLKYNSYANDYSELFDKQAKDNDFEYESFYHIEDNEKNYNLLTSVVSNRFETWNQYKDK